MKICKRFFKFSLIIILLNLPVSLAYSKTAPSSFADLAEKLMPSVVNISSTQTVKTTSNPFPFQFPPGSPFEDMFKDFNRPTERKATALGSGFIIDKKGIVVTNNHVIQGAEDIIVSVNGATEYKAKVLGKDPYMDLAVLQIESEDKFEPKPRRIILDQLLFRKYLAFSLFQSLFFFVCLLSYCFLPLATAAADLKSSIREFVQEPIKTLSMATELIEVLGFKWI